MLPFCEIFRPTCIGITAILRGGAFPLWWLMVIFCAGLFAGYTFLYKYPQVGGFTRILRISEKELVVPDTKDTERLTARIEQLVVTPPGEKPTVATLTDADQLQNQPFFRSAQDGDIVLVYPDSKAAILYRPSADKIVNMSFISVGVTGSGGNLQTPTASPTPTPTPAQIRKKQ